jgi:hypothetical protein
LIEECVAEIREWLNSIKLSLNLIKSEVILLGSRQLIKQCAPPVLHLGDLVLTSKSSVRDLGVFLDQSLTLDRQISQVSSSAFLYLRVIAKVRRALSTSQCLTLVHSLVVSRLLFCCSIYYKITVQQLQRLQRVLNAAIRLVARKRKFDHIGDIAQNFNLLPMDKLVLLRMCNLIFSVIHFGQPKYLFSELEFCSVPGLRSSNSLTLKVRHCANNMGTRAFYTYAPLVWNSIPMDIRTSSSPHVFREKNAITLKFHHVMLTVECVV